MHAYLRIMDGNQLTYFPVTIDDIMAAKNKLGTILGSLKGKTTRRESTAAMMM